MALIIEDGSIVAGANSYATTDQLVAYASARGTDLSTLTTTQQEVLLIKAMDYIEARRGRFQGCKTNEDQALQWPRYDVWVDGYSVDSDSMPPELISAQLALATEANSQTLQPNQLPEDSGAVISEQVGSLKVEYAEPASLRTQPLFTAAESLLSPLYKRSGIGLMRT